MKPLYLLPILALALLLNSHQASAQPLGAGVQILPSIIEERVIPGQWLSKTLTITNISDERVNYEFVRRDIIDLSKEGAPIFKDTAPTGLELSSWIRLPQSTLSLGPRQTKKIQFSISVPREAAPGSHVASLLLARTPDPLKKSGAAVGYQVGPIIHLRIAGTIFEEAEFKEFRANRFVYRRPEVEFSATIANLGNVIVRPRGPIEIANMFGQKVGTVVMNDNGAAVLPKTERTFLALWKNGGLGFGRYQALASLAFGEDGVQTISRTTSFWILPWHLIIPTALGLIMLVLALLFLIKSHIRKKLSTFSKAVETMAHQGPLANLERDLIHKKKHAPLSALGALLIAIAIFIILFVAIIFLFFA